MVHNPKRITLTHAQSYCAWYAAKLEQWCAVKTRFMAVWTDDQSHHALMHDYIHRVTI